MSDNIYEQLSEERKRLQDEGELPLWYSTGGWQLFKSKYQFESKGFKGQAERIAKTAAKHTVLENAESRFFDLLWKGWLSPSTPVLSNMGTDRGLPVSCSGGYVGDGIYEFYESIKEAAILSKHGFGTSGYLGDVRPRGSKISIGGTASGIMPVIKDFVTMSRNVSQGSQRRGAWAGYVPVDHGDFWELITYIEQNPDDLNIGWVITDDFISRLDNDDEESIRKFGKILKVKMVTGKGYFFFVDKVNRHRPECYKLNSLDIKGSNLCVSPETLILTDFGNVRIDSLEDQFVNVWNGSEYSNVQIKKTGTNQKLIKVVTNAGFEIECTPYHKFYTIGTNRRNKPTEVRAIDLKVGDKLIKLVTPVVEGFKELDLAYQNGFYSGDGCKEKNNSRVYLYGEKRKLVEFFKPFSTTWCVQELQDREYGNIKGLEEKFFVPDESYTVGSRLQWLAGLFDADGTSMRNGKSQTLQLASVEPSFIRDIQFLLQSLGVQSKVKHARDAGEYQLPANDGTGETKAYDCRKVERILISGMGIVQLLKLGIVFNRLVVSDHVPNRNAESFVSVEEIVDTGRVSDTYCFTEPKKHMGVFNGILTGQCSEIMLHSSEEFTYTCVLSSMNVALYDEWKDTDAAYVATVFLDCVAQDFIESAKSIKGLEKAISFTENGRALGLGVCGFHTYLQTHMMPFDSVDAIIFNDEVFSHINKQSKQASKWMASVYGEPEWCKGTGMRNTHTMAIAPTKSTALLMGGVSEGINPDPAMTYTQMSAGGEIERISRPLYDHMISTGIFSKAKIKEVISKNGSVQDVNWLTDEEKLVFRTAFELPQESIIILASNRQQYIDQGQSLNLFFSSVESPKYIAKVHKQAFKDENILSLYYVYSMAGVKASTGECEACQ